MSSPNVVFVITDDQGYGDLGCHGNDIIQTPNLDQLYTESVRFTNYHVGPTCAPTRAGIMTGRYCNCTGVWHTIAGTLAIAPRRNHHRRLLQSSGISHRHVWQMAPRRQLSISST